MKKPPKRTLNTTMEHPAMQITVRIAAHPLQVAIAQLVADRGIDDLTLRAIGEQIGASGRPQQIKHHLQQLVRYGFLDIIDGTYRLGNALQGTTR